MSGHLPDRAAFRDLAARGTLVPVVRELVLDADTPVSAYAKLRPLAGDGPRFLLESVVGGATWAAYSFLGLGARARLVARGGRVRIERVDLENGGAVTVEERAEPDPTRALEALLASERPVELPSAGRGTGPRPRLFGGAVGWLSYDVVRAFERLPARTPDELGLADADFVVPDVLVIFDNLRQTVRVVSWGSTRGDLDRSWARAAGRVDEVVAALQGPAPRIAPLEPAAALALPSVRHHTSRDTFLDSVARAKEYILAGDAFQVVLSQRLSLPAAGVDAFDVYRALRVVNPSPYMFHLAYPDAEVAGASPEVLVRVEGGRVSVRPIAGTRPRGATPEEDARLEAELRADPKECAEHVMLIDLGRNDVGRVSQIGSVRVDEEMVVERYSHVMHLVSHVSGALRPGLQPLDALRACFPAGTLSGAPKIRAMEIIEELEPSRRGLYGGAVGYVGWGGTLDFAIAIRSLLKKDDTLFVQAGAGIVADSDPAAEWQETLHKANAVLRALAMAGHVTGVR